MIKGFFERLMDWLNRPCEECVVLTKQNNILRTEIDDLLRELDNERAIIKQLEKDKEVVKLKQLIDFKNFYEKAIPSVPYVYDFDNSGRAKNIKYALRVTAKGEEAIESKAREIIKKYKLTSSEPINKVLEAVMRYYSSRGLWTYIKERIDNWELAEESVITNRGDCDALAILMHNITIYILRNLGLESHEWRLRFMGTNTLLEPHAVNIWLSENGEFYTMESTIDLQGSLKYKWLNVPTRLDSFYHNYICFATKTKSWKGLRSTLKNFMEESK